MSKVVAIVIVVLLLAGTAVAITLANRHHTDPAQQFNNCIQHAISNGTPVQDCSNPAP